uniref:CUB domain-containing protein n=1 Tax=Macrostomum lignano TaxID=282301 RepID=A0A1I8I3A3_9PLAT
CGGTILLPKLFSWSTLRYPDSLVTNSAGYRPGATCEWQVVSLDPQSEIFIRVRTFRLAQPEGGNCLADSLTVYADGENDTQNYCGDHGPPPKFYKSRRLSIRFRAALSGPLAGREGFELVLGAVRVGYVSLQAGPQERRLGLETLRSTRYVRIFAERRTQFLVLNITAVA